MSDVTKIRAERIRAHRPGQGAPLGPAGPAPAPPPEPPQNPPKNPRKTPKIPKAQRPKRPLLWRLLRPFVMLFAALFSYGVLGFVMAVLFLALVIDIFDDDLPTVAFLGEYKPAMISRIYSSEGQLVDEFAKERRLFTPIEEIPPIIAHAFVSAEDKNFYTHNGYDPRGIVSAINDAVVSRGQNVRGASTITQQVVRTFLLSADRRAERKIKEVLLATKLEKALSKDQILEIYLNEIFLGQNSYGVTAAAQIYFNKTLGELAPHEAAFLASMPKAPGDFHPVRRKERVTDRRNFVLKEMVENGYLDRSVAEVEALLPLKSVQNGDYEAFRVALPPRDYYTDEIRRQLSRDFGEETFFTEGLTVRATIDPQMQEVAARALRRKLEEYDRGRGIYHGPLGRIEGIESLSEAQWRQALGDIAAPRGIEVEGPWFRAVVLQLGTTAARIGVEGVADDADGHWILASDVTWARPFRDGKPQSPAKAVSDLLSVGDVVYVENRASEAGAEPRWSLRQIPKIQGAFVAMDVNNGRVIAMQGGFAYEHSVYNRATQAMRQPGSNFKPFVYAAALDSGYSPATIVVDAPIEVNTPDGVWRPQNASEKFYGPTPLRTGIEQSRNLMTVRLAQEVGMDTIARYAEKFGMYSELSPFLANSLGSQETTLYNVVSAYAMFANGGERIEPTLVDRIQDRTGKTIYKHDPRICVDCDSYDLATGRVPLILSRRERVMDPITAYQLTSMLQGVVERGTAAKAIDLPVPVAGKTGTTNDAKDVWFTGFTSNLVAGCYIGFDNPEPLGRGAFGSSLCAPVFQEFMQEAIKTYGGGPFSVPSGGQFIKIDRFSGARLADDAEGGNVVAEYFREGEEPLFGLAFDGGFAMGTEVPLFDEARASVRAVTNSAGNQAIIGDKATAGALGTGGLY